MKSITRIGGIAALCLLSASACATRMPDPFADGTRLDPSSINRTLKDSDVCKGGLCDKPPQLIAGNRPHYPPGEKSMGTKGEATITFTIRPDGHTGNIVIRSASAPGFAHAALAAIEGWQFKPATLHGKPVSVSVGVPFNFDIPEQTPEDPCANGYYCDTPAHIINGPAPVYPAKELAEDTEGAATIVYTIKPDGSTDDYRIDHATTEGFADAAIDTLRHWRFAPATLHGKPVPSFVRQVFYFRIDEPDPAPPASP